MKTASRNRILTVKQLAIRLSELFVLLNFASLILNYIGFSSQFSFIKSVRPYLVRSVSYFLDKYQDLRQAVKESEYA